MRKIYILAILLNISLFGSDGIIKKDADLESILNKIEAISQTIKQKEKEEMELREQMHQTPPTPAMQEPQMDEEEKLQRELEREEKELSLKQKKLEIIQRKEEYEQRYDSFKRKTKAYLQNKTKKLLWELKKELYKLEKQKVYKVDIDSFMKIGNEKYAYLKSSQIQVAKNYLDGIDRKIKNIKSTIKRLENAKNMPRDKWFQIVSNLENGLDDQPNQLQASNQSVEIQPAPQYSQSQMSNKSIKVKIGEVINNLYVKSINENSVFLALKEK